MVKERKKEVEFLTTSQLARIMGISRIAVYKKIVKGDIKATKVGKLYIIPKSYISEIFGRSTSAQKKISIDLAVRRTIKEYGDVLIKLGKE